MNELKSTVNHHLYADDTQLYMFFCATNFCYNTPHLERTISSVLNWISSDFLSFNPSKTKFLLIGLPQQLAKLNSPTVSLPDCVTLSPVPSARNLGVIFKIQICHSLNTSLPFLNLVFVIFVISNVSEVL